MAVEEKDERERERQKVKTNQTRTESLAVNGVVGMMPMRRSTACSRGY